MKQLGEWLDQFDWPALVGSALVLVFFLGVIVPVVSSPALVGQQQEQAAQSQNQDEYARIGAPQGGDEALARYTLWLVVFTAILAISTIGLWLVTAETLRHAKDDAARQAADSRWQRSNMYQSNITARRAALASTITANAARDSANAALSQLKPRLAISARGLQRKPLDGPITVWSNTLNTGGSTAYKLQILTGVQFLPHPLQEAIPRSSPPDRNHGAVDMPPRQDSGHASSRAMVRSPTAQEMTDWRDGTYALYVHGTLFYETEFGDRIELDYCQFLSWESYEMWRANPVARGGGVADAIFRIALFGNDTRITRKA
jgi:hypothetical protein